MFDVTVMQALLFVLHVCMQKECEGARLVWGWMRCGCGECRACGWHTCFRSWPTQMTSPSHPHTQARVQPRNIYNHTYRNFLLGQNKTISY